MKNHFFSPKFFNSLLGRLLGLGTICLVAFGYYSFVDAEESTNPTPAATPALEIPREEVLMGLWREGQAVETDVPILDIFTAKRYKRGHQPEQPINYSHVVHVKQNGIECQYCHSGVAKSSYATIPPVELCMGCHNVIKTESPEIKKLKEHWEKKIPVEWIPVHNLPEHANFNHQRHIKAGVGCQNCHGQVQNMEVVERVSTMKMGFCISCHRDQGVSIDCGICHY
jgi:hypothetical protein